MTIPAVTNLLPLTASTEEKLARYAAKAEANRANLVAAYMAAKPEIEAQLAEAGPEMRNSHPEVFARIESLTHMLATETSAAWWAGVGEVPGNRDVIVTRIFNYIQCGAPLSRASDRAAWIKRYG